MSPAGPIRVRLDTRSQKVRLGLGLLVLLGLVVLFVIAAVVTADTTARRSGAWVVAVVLLAATALVAYLGRLAVRPQAIVVSNAGISRDAAAQPWLVGWSELEKVTVDRSWHRIGRYQNAWRPKVWRVTLRLVPRDPDSFVTLHPPLAVYRGRFGASQDEFAVLLGPARELVVPLDEALREHAGEVYGGVVDLDRIGPDGPR